MKKEWKVKPTLIVMVALIALVSGCCTHHKIAATSFADSVGEEYMIYVEKDPELGKGIDGKVDPKMREIEIKVRRNNLETFKAAFE